MLKFQPAVQYVFLASLSVKFIFSRLYPVIHQYSFYCPVEGGRLSQPRHCSKGAQPMPKAVYRSGRCDKHKAMVGFDHGT